MSALGFVAGLNILAIIACMCVLYAEFEYMSAVSKASMVLLTLINGFSLLINMGVIR
ncbi:hypothetical protein ABINADI_269 [Bacillus phage vB_BanH_Abinadi]|nr:hypothetical protein ABINADI_269 [Bacillus phage vB_BanH_Abinadi]